MRTLVLAAIAGGAFFAMTFGNTHDAHAVVCARGVYHAGCAGPNHAVAVRRPAVAAPHRGVCRRYGVVGGVRRCVLY
jgi:hypothetical protein